MLVSMADGEGERTKILDFGIAKLRQEQEQAKVGKLTQTGAMMGTPHYISPEQCREAKDVDGRADVYSLGAMLFHMVTGQPPFDGSTAPLIMLKHLNNPPPDLAKLNPKLPFELTDIVRRMLQKTPEERPTMKEVADTLLGLCDAQAAVKAASSPSLSGRTALRPVDPAAPGRTTTRGEAGGGAVTAVGEAPLEIRIEAGTPVPAHKTTIPPPRRSRVRQLVAGVLGLALCGMGAGVVIAMRSHPSEPGRGGERAPLAVPSALVQVAVLSEPPGALLIRLPDGQPLGRTPYKVQMPRGGVLRAKLQLDGFLDRDVVLYLDQDARREERLTRAPTVRKPR